MVRPFIAMFVGGMVALPLMLPTTPQLLAAIKTIPSMKGAMPFLWWQNVAGGLLCGIRWVDDDVGNPQNLALARLLAAHGWLWVLVLAGALLVTAGMVIMMRHGGMARVIAFAGPLAVMLKWLPIRKSFVGASSRMYGAPYQPLSSGARSVTPALNMAKPPSVFS